ncbi:MAG: histidine kinase [Bacteroidetes bacterium]|nr:histidine kinase [Bacteroidota bacterium]
MFGGSFKSGVYPANYSSPSNAKIAFLTSNGICIVSDEVLATQPYYPQFRIDSVFYAGIRADSLQQILDIKYDEAIDFYFSSYSSNFRSTAKIQYRTSDEISWIDLDDSRHLLLSGLSLGSHTIQFRVSADGLNWKEAGDKRTINVSLPWYLSYTFYAYFFIFMAVLVFTIYKRRVGIIRKEEAAKTKIAMQQAEQEMKVLRAQMNPHFIFNALNSIHNCILQRDTLTAANSLTKFSRLVRKILDNSLQSTISLESELATLELYIQIEQLRFNTKFEYTITVDPAIDPASTMVPPLILQPFVENSIWHGLMPSEKKGSIMVEVSRRRAPALYHIR